MQTRDNNRNYAIMIVYSTKKFYCAITNHHEHHGWRNIKAYSKICKCIIR